MNELGDEFSRQRRELEETQEALLKELRLKQLILGHFVPPEFRRQITPRLRYDEDEEKWVLTPSAEMPLLSASWASKSELRPVSDYEKMARSAEESLSSFGRYKVWFPTKESYFFGIDLIRKICSFNLFYSVRILFSSAWTFRSALQRITSVLRSHLLCKQRWQRPFSPRTHQWKSNLPDTRQWTFTHSWNQPAVARCRWSNDRNHRAIRPPPTTDAITPKAMRRMEPF